MLADSGYASEDTFVRADADGQLKSCQKLTIMSRRGLAACENEWLLACAAHKPRKLPALTLTADSVSCANSPLRRTGRAERVWSWPLA